MHWGERLQHLCSPMGTGIQVTVSRDSRARSGAEQVSHSSSTSPAEPPVRILHPPQRSLELPVQAPGRVELRCELSVPEAPVRWFKDGLEVDESDNLLLLAEGAWRCLLIPRSSAEDTGEYICESKDEAVSFDVKVSGQWGPRSGDTLTGLWPRGLSQPGRGGPAPL